MKKSSEKTLLTNGFVITCDEKFRHFENGFVSIAGNRIDRVGSTKEAAPRKSAYDRVIDVKNHVVMPGLVSLHFHSDNLSRGVGEHMGLEEWLDRIYYPMLAAMEPKHSRIASSLAYAEAIKSGTTCANDMYRHIIACAESAEKMGIRTILSSEAADLIPRQESLEDNEEAFRRKNNSADGRIKVWFGVEWIPVCSQEFLRKARELASKYRTGIHIHLNESSDEVKICKEKNGGLAPTELAHKLGVLGPDVVAAHCVWLNDEEISMMKETGTSVSHNPVSNMKLGNGIARVSEMLEAGINVGLGPDDAPCNNTVDMFEVMKFASLAQKARLLDASQLPSEQIIRMATINGAKALGLEAEIGSLEAGKKADVITINLQTPRLTPVIAGKHSNVFAHVVYSAHGEDVDNSIIDGRLVMKDRKLVTADEKTLIKNATRASHDLISRVLK
ncbi:MAG TPA: amidohydrolase [Nitrososphaerales archaeon]|nr:amidohydrolase [Nitrososphaerales archaeon]